MKLPWLTVGAVLTLPSFILSEEMSSPDDDSRDNAFAFVFTSSSAEAYAWIAGLLVLLLGTCLGISISISICIFNNCQLWRTHCSSSSSSGETTGDICICKSVTRVRNICLHNDKLTLMPSKPPPTAPATTAARPSLCTYTTSGFCLLRWLYTICIKLKNKPNLF